MADELTIRAVLTAYSGFTALIGGAVTPRLWDQVVPPKEPTPVATPYVTMSTIVAVPERYLAQAPDQDFFTIQFDVYAKTKSEARAVLVQLRAALNGAGYVDGEQVSRDLPAGDPLLKRLSSEWLFILSR